MKTSIIEKTINFVKAKLKDFEGGHDWWHAYRVWKMSIVLAEGEKIDSNVVQLSALLHDLVDKKFPDHDSNDGEKEIIQFLKEGGVDQERLSHILHIVNNLSFKENKTLQHKQSKEFMIVQDADRLDALGAIGIARAFNFGGYRGREIYNPGIEPRLNMSSDEYKKHEGPTLNHFYEKLLRLKDLMNTEKAKIIAEGRHRFLEEYLKQFLREWDVEA